MKMKKLTKHIKTYSRGLAKIRRNIIIKIKSNYLEMIYMKSNERRNCQREM